MVPWWLWIGAILAGLFAWLYLKLMGKHRHYGRDFPIHRPSGLTADQIVNGANHNA